MKLFSYKAKKGLAEVLEGKIAATNQGDAIDKINQMGLLPIEVNEEIRSQQRQASGQSVSLWRKKLGANELSIFSRQFAALVRSGVSVLEALHIISEQVSDPYLKQVVGDMYDIVRGGESLSTALGNFQNIFSAFDISMIHAGESVGKIEQSLAQIAQYRQNQAAIESKVRSAIAYPAFVIVVGVGTIAFMLSYVIPQFSKFFSDLGQDLPMPTRFLITASQWMQNNWLWCAVILSVAILGTRWFAHKEMTRAGLDRLVLRIPIIGNLIVKREIARFNRSFQMLIASGLQLLQALKIATDTVTNKAIREELETCFGVVEGGGFFSSGLKRSRIIPPFVASLTGVGEEGGRLDEAVGEVAAWYEQEVEETIKIMTSLLEPIIILAIGLVLGMIIIAVLLPIFSMNALTT